MRKLVARLTGWLKSVRTVPDVLVLVLGAFSIAAVLVEAMLVSRLLALVSAGLLLTGGVDAIVMSFVRRDKGHSIAPDKITKGLTPRAHLHGWALIFMIVVAVPPPLWQFLGLSAENKLRALVLLAIATAVAGAPLFIWGRHFRR